LYSPRYFESEACGKEWYAFARRALDHKAKHGSLIEAIVPALWATVKPANLPEAARVIQFDHQSFGRRYSRDGFYGIMKLGRYRPEYRQAVLRLARRIVDVAEQAQIAPVTPVDDFDSLPRSFGLSAGSNANRQLRITVAAPDLQALPRGREPSFYGASPLDWRPYQPTHTQPVAEYAAELTKMMGYTTTINTIAEEISEQAADDVPPALGLFLLDAWSTLSDHESEQIREFDRLAQPWVNLMVPWSELDQQTQEAEKELRKHLQASVTQMLSRAHPKHRMAITGISSLSKFGDIIPLLVYNAERIYLKNLPARPPVGPPRERPRLMGPYIEDSS